MLATHNRTEAEMLTETKKEIIYVYRPILGGILGIWRLQHTTHLRTEVHLHLNCDIHDLDKVFVNEKEVEIKYKEV